MKIVHITTAGSVDDGKSTLIGRLLHDTHAVSADKIASVQKTSLRKGLGEMDYSLFTDGLIAEREQGITIDVAHLYFSTPKRKFIIADTPGHIEYTRNMVTGASNSDIAILLIDVRNGVIEQSKRHLFIAHLLHLKYIIVAVNKMDLVQYDQNLFNGIVSQFTLVANQFGYNTAKITFLPVSAKNGDNVTFSSPHMPWYGGNTLLQLLENIELESCNDNENMLFNMQYVIRPNDDKHHDFRAYAGKLNAGTLKVGDTVYSFPSRKKATVTELFKGRKAIQEAYKGDSISVCLDKDIDLSRGDWFLNEHDAFTPVKTFKAHVCWLSDTVSARIGERFILQYGSTQTRVKLNEICSELSMSNLTFEKTSNSLTLNSITVTSWETAQETLLTAGSTLNTRNRFILIDEQTNGTVGVGIVC